MSKNKLVCKKSQVMRRLAYQTMILEKILQKLELCDYMCVLYCKKKKIEEKPKLGR